MGQWPAVRSSAVHRGGSEALRNHLLSHYPEGVVLPDPVMSNALGLARYAVRLFDLRENGDR